MLPISCLGALVGRIMPCMFAMSIRQAVPYGLAKMTRVLDMHAVHAFDVIHRVVTVVSIAVASGQAPRLRGEHACQ
jgi:hypothetical protein